MKEKSAQSLPLQPLDGKQILRGGGGGGGGGGTQKMTPSGMRECCCWQMHSVAHMRLRISCSLRRR